MAVKPPLSERPIKTADPGFYRGFSVDVTVVSKIIIGALLFGQSFGRNGLAKSLGRGTDPSSTTSQLGTFGLSRSL